MIHINFNVTTLLQVNLGLAGKLLILYELMKLVMLNTIA